MSPKFGKAKYGKDFYGADYITSQLFIKRWFTARKQVGKRVIYRYYSRTRKQDIYPYVVPHNPQTPAQQANRMKFADAMAAWAALPQATKDTYEHRVRDRQMYGKNLFVKEYMLSP